MKKNSKAQGLSLQTIVISILALIVLAVIIFVFSGKMGDVKTGLDDCESKGGDCDKADCQGPKIENTKDCKDYCCIPIGTATGS